MKRPEREPIERAGAFERKGAAARMLAAQPRAVLVVNTRSRRGRAFYREAHRLLATHGMALTAAHAVRDPARIPQIVRAAVAAGEPLVIVGGGDGTISSVAGCFAYRDAALAILPLGTANSFARALGIPLDLGQAVEVACHGKVADVDLGQLNDGYFANAAAIGLPATIARHMPVRLKRWLGRFGYLLVALRRLTVHRAFRCAVRTSGGNSSFDALEVRIANGGYQGGVRVADEASVESRDLVIQYIKGRSRGAIARFWWRALLGLPARTEDVEILRVGEFVLDCMPPQFVSVDGEPVTRTPVRGRVARQALLVRVPNGR